MAQRLRNYHFTWNLSPKQRELFESDAQFRVGMMGRRFGKNELGTASLVDYATRPDTYRFGTDDTGDVIAWWTGPTYRQAYKYGYLKTIEKLPDDLIASKSGSEYRKSEIHLTTGPELEFLSYSNPSGLQGAGVDFIVGDEWAYSVETVWQADLRPMLIDSGGGALFISKPLKDHFTELFDRGQDPSFPDWYSVHATAYENPFIDDAEIDKARRELPERIFNREFLADPESSGLVFTRDSLTFTDFDDLPDREYRFIVGVDIGIEADTEKARENDSDYWACAVFAIDGLHSIAYLLNIYRERGMGMTEGLNWIETISDSLPSQPVINIESVQAQRWLADAAQERGLSVNPVTQTLAKENRIIQLSIPFEAGKIQLVNQDNNETLGYDPRFDDFVSELLSWPNARHDDQLDACEIALRNVQLTQYDGLEADMYGQE